MAIHIRDEYAPDARKSLQTLQSEWSGCTRCKLGHMREECGGRQVFGAGAPGAKILIIGEAPGATEAETGEQYSGAIGEKILWPALKELNMLEMVHVTGMVLCRSFDMVIGPDGLPVMTNYGRMGPTPRLEEVPPTPECREACAERLFEEIYIVDPIVIVAMGGMPTEFLSGKPIAITMDNTSRIIEIPGAVRNPVLTEARGVWARKKDGIVVRPTARNMVKYILIPCVSPSYVAPRTEDVGENAPWTKFLKSLVAAKKIVEMYDYVQKES